MTSLLLALALSAHAGDGLERLDSCDALAERVADQWTEQIASGYTTWGWGGAWGRRGMWDAEAPALASEDGGGGGGAPSSFTGTNVQEQGVDELDLVKTDGRFVYVLNGGELAIVKSWPVAEAEKLAGVPISGAPTSLFLHGDRVVVASYVYPYDADGTWNADAFYGTRLTLIDVTDRADPKVERTIDLEGTLASGRMIDGDVYLVLNGALTVPGDVWSAVQGVDVPFVDPAATPMEQERVRARQRATIRPLVKRALAGSDPSTWLPRWTDRPTDGTPATGRLMACGDVAASSEASDFGVLTLLHLDLDRPEMRPQSTGVLGGGWTVYASQESLYVAQGHWSGWWSGDDVSTKIHKFSLRGPGGRAKYVASGRVEGWMLNQFAMSEHEGDLRVAATDQDWWWGTGRAGSGSSVTVLGDDGRGRLVKKGFVGGIAPGEQVYGVRFVGEKGYLVTFRQIDPLWTIDLKDPTKPRVRGQLHIPGYSAYLHPMDDGHLLAVGMDGDMSGRVDGLKISIFDVSDMDDPREVHKFTLRGEGWSWSEALSDHHAFTWADGVLSLPFYGSGYDAATGRYRYDSGLLVLRADAEEGIREIGRVNHDHLARQACLATAGAETCDSFHAQSGYWYGYGYYNQMRRSLYLEDTLVSISSVGIDFRPLRAPRKSLASVVLAPRETRWW